MALTDKLSAIGEAIRAKTGKSDKLTLDQMPSEIAGITGSGSDITLLENLPFELDFASGDMSFEAPNGYAVKSAIVKQPATLIPANIKSGVEVAGITGTLSGGGANPDANDPVYYVTFMNGDQVLYVRPVVKGDTCPDVKTKGWITTPTKESDEGYTYEHSGWSATNGGSASTDVLNNITGDKTVYAAYTATVKKYLITFYDDDGTTVLSTKEVAYGSYPSYTPTKDDVIFDGWVPALAKVTGDASYTATWIASVVTNGLIQASWQTISDISSAGTAANYFSIGDAKQITMSGTWRGTTLNQTRYVFIIGINHNSDLEGTGIQFSGFRNSRTSSTNEPRCLIVDYNAFNYQKNQGCIMSAYAKNFGGWAASDMRYGVLGSTDIAPSEYGNATTEASVGYDPTPTCATNPVPDTLMSCMPADLRSVMKPITKWTNNVGGKTNVAENITASIDYLPLLSEKEVFGSTKFSSSYEATKQMQYAYYANGGSKIYYAWPSSTAEKVNWWTRSPEKSREDNFTFVYNSGTQASTNGYYSYGVVPVFMV